MGITPVNESKCRPGSKSMHKRTLDRKKALTTLSSWSSYPRKQERKDREKTKKERVTFILKAAILFVS